MSLKVNTRIPGGNATDIEILEDSICPEVRFASDPYEAPEALWFCFRLVETASDPVRQTQGCVILIQPAPGEGAGPTILAISVGRVPSRGVHGEE